MAERYLLGYSLITGVLIMAVLLGGNVAVGYLPIATNGGYSMIGNTEYMTTVENVTSGWGAWYDSTMDDISDQLYEGPNSTCYDCCPTPITDNRSIGISVNATKVHAINTSLVVSVTANTLVGFHIRTNTTAIVLGLAYIAENNQWNITHPAEVNPNNIVNTTAFNATYIGSFVVYNSWNKVTLSCENINSTLNYNFTEFIVVLTALGSGCVELDGLHFHNPTNLWTLVGFQDIGASDMVIMSVIALLALMMIGVLIGIVYIKNNKKII